MVLFVPLTGIEIATYELMTMNLFGAYCFKFRDSYVCHWKVVTGSVVLILNFPLQPIKQNIIS